MGKMAALDIDRTNKFLNALDYISQFIDLELMPKISVTSNTASVISLSYTALHEQLMTLQGVIDDYRNEIKGE